VLFVKKLRILSLLVVIMTTSSLPSAAADTVNIASKQLINICSAPNDQKFLIYVDLGEIYFSDSLMSFDIFLKYDTTKLVFTDMLNTGTLSAQMSDLGPVWRPKDPGGFCYAGGASILKNAKGNIPLIAFQGVFKGQCGDTTTVSLDEASFNTEFKRQYNASTSGVVRTYVKGTLSNDVASVFLSRSMVTGGKDSIVSVPLRVKTPGLSNASIECTVTLQHGGFFKLDTIQPLVQDTTVIVTSIDQGAETTTLKWQMKASGEMQDFNVLIRSLSNVNGKVAVMNATFIVIDSCFCVGPKNTDSMSTCTIENKTTSTSVREKVVDEGIAWYTTLGGDIVIQSLHGQPESIEIFTLLGEQLPVVARGDQMTMVISGDHLPNAPVLVRVSVGGEIRLKMVMK